MMMKKLQTQEEKLQTWLQNESEKDSNDLEKQKKILIEQIKKLKKEDLIPKNNKLTIWERIKKVLVG